MVKNKIFLTFAVFFAFATAEASQTTVDLIIYERASRVSLGQSNIQLNFDNSSKERRVETASGVFTVKVVSRAVNVNKTPSYWYDFTVLNSSGVKVGNLVVTAAGDVTAATDMSGQGALIFTADIHRPQN